MIFHFVIHNQFGISYNYYLLIACKLVLLLTSVYSFLSGIKPFKSSAIYFVYYMCSLISLLIVYIFEKAILSVLFFVFFLLPMAAYSLEWSDETYQICTRAPTLTGTCCTYDIYEENYELFQNKLCSFYYDPNDKIHFSSLKTLKVKKDSFFNL